jgi:hypothetical protein
MRGSTTSTPLDLSYSPVVKRLALFALLGLSACPEVGPLTPDASSDASIDDVVAPVEGACAEPIEVYCDANACPSSPSAALVGDCNGYTLTGCGFTNAVGSFGVDTGYVWIFDDAGTLIGVDFDNNGSDKCLGGPTNAVLTACACPQGCAQLDAGCD